MLRTTVATLSARCCQQVEVLAVGCDVVCRLKIHVVLEIIGQRIAAANVISLTELVVDAKDIGKRLLFAVFSLRAGLAPESVGMNGLREVLPCLVFGDLIFHVVVDGPALGIVAQIELLQPTAVPVLVPCATGVDGQSFQRIGNARDLDD